MSEGKYAINKKTDLTYVSQLVGKHSNIRYISKVFDIEDFKDYYYSSKDKKVFEVIRESARQEITAIYDQDTTGFSIRIQRFSKETGAPHNQSFSFHGGALIKFIKFLETIDILDLSSSGKMRFTDKYVDDLLERKNAFKQIVNKAISIKPEQLLELFNNLESEDRNILFQKFIDNIESYEAENLDAAIKQKEYKQSLKHLERLLEIEKDIDFIEQVKSDAELSQYNENQPEKILQNWIESNLWIFGVEYHKKHDFSKIGEDNSKADIVLETADGFLSLIEIKRPIVKSKMFRYDKSHRSYFPASSFSEAIGQCLIYLQRIEDFKKSVESEHSVRILRPRVRLIIGRSNEFIQGEIEALHFINSSLHDIDVITYDHLIENGKKIISFYEK